MAKTAILTMQDLIDQARRAFLELADAAHPHLAQSGLINAARAVVREIDIDCLLDLLAQPFETVPPNMIRCNTPGPYNTEVEVLIDLIAVRIVSNLVHDDAIQEMVRANRKEINIRNGTINDLPITAL